MLISRRRVRIISVSQKHAHLIVELPRKRMRAKEVVGTWKAARTPAARKVLSGAIWGEGGKYKPVKSREHLRCAFKYIRDEQGPGAWDWTHQQGVPEEVTKAVTRTLRDRARKRMR